MSSNFPAMIVVLWPPSQPFDKCTLSLAPSPHDVGYDADRRLISVTEPLSSGTNRTTYYDYYENAALKDITDADGNVTHWEVDLESRPVSKTYAYGTSNAETETLAYEQTTSRLKSLTDALSQIKSYTYGLDDRDRWC